MMRSRKYQNESVEVVAADEPVEDDDEEVESKDWPVHNGDKEVVLIDVLFQPDKQKLFYLIVGFKYVSKNLRFYFS